MREKPSVLMLAQLPPPVHGASVMNKTIADSALVNAAFALETINIATAESISDIGKTSLKKYGKFLALWRRVVSALRRRPDLVYLTLSPFGAAFVKDALLALTAKAFGARLVYHLHGKGIGAEFARGGWRAALYRRVFADAQVISLAPALYRDIERVVPSERVHFLGNGVNSQAIELAREADAPVSIVYLSNMVPTKGARVLLEAAKLLAERGLDFRVRYAGNWGTDPQFKQDFLAFIETHWLADKVQYLGPQYGDDKKKLLCSGDVFVLPTYFRNECFPLAILEAMSCALPVVSTFEGAIPDLVKDGESGFLVAQQDVTALADALEKLIRDPALRQRLGAAGLASYEANYTVSAFEGQFVAILRRVLERAS